MTSLIHDRTQKQLNNLCSPQSAFLSYSSMSPHKMGFFNSLCNSICILALGVGTRKQEKLYIDHHTPIELIEGIILMHFLTSMEIIHWQQDPP